MSWTGIRSSLSTDSVPLVWSPVSPDHLPDVEVVRDWEVGYSKEEEEVYESNLENTATFFWTWFLGNVGPPIKSQLIFVMELVLLVTRNEIKNWG